MGGQGVMEVKVVSQATGWWRGVVGGIYRSGVGRVLWVSWGWLRREMARGEIDEQGLLVCVGVKSRLALKPGGVLASCRSGIGNSKCKMDQSWG